jgi:hypothetical protein
MKTRLLLLVFILIAISAFLWWSADWFGTHLKPASRSARSQPVSQSHDENSPAVTNTGGRFGGRVATPPVETTNVVAAALPAATASTSTPGVSPSPAPLEAHTPATVALDSLRTTFRQYNAMYGGNPVGSNPEIARALNGDNPKHVRFSIADGNRINDKGELVDVWGTPYFFHQLSANQTEIRSAGPDQKMWSSDDVVIR